MAQGEGFKHITVTAADEDDVVIVAGVAQEEEPRPQLSPSGLAESQEDALSPDPAQPQNVFPDDPLEARSSSPVREARVSQPLKTHQGKTSAAGDGYRETTLEDLERTPMPFAQKVTVVAAVVLIVVAVVYYFVAMG